MLDVGMACHIVYASDDHICCAKLRCCRTNMIDQHVLRLVHSDVLLLNTTDRIDQSVYDLHEMMSEPLECSMAR